MTPLVLPGRATLRSPGKLKVNTTTTSTTSTTTTPTFNFSNTIGTKYSRCSVTQFSSDHHKHRPTIGLGIHVQEDTDTFPRPAQPGRWYPISFPHPLLSRPCSKALGALAHPLYIPPAPLNAREFWRGCRERYYGGRRR